MIARQSFSLCYQPDAILSTLHPLTHLIITQKPYAVDTAITRGTGDISKEGAPARSHHAAATVGSPCPIAASCGFAWETKLYVGDSAEFGIRELGLNPGAASSLLCFPGQNT